MMKPVQLFALRVMMMVVVSAAPRPTPVFPSHDNPVTPHLLNEEGNSTRINNDSLDLRNGTTNGTVYFSPALRRCFLPTCGIVNLGSSLQRGDEKAGGATTDPFGNGKK
ncbi:uncharacterized protein zgc:193726 [Anabas testudineus]|uniref:uncharacterized protein zgc:193726 n=1 Tax=Anabas testudineus TaxID=64144 RepID=UPI00143DCC56|nr:uncharacterized protein zgc:193726 [Anabas testudineus]